MAHLVNLIINGDIMNSNLLVLRATILLPLILMSLKDTYCGWYSYVFKRESCDNILFQAMCPVSMMNYAAHMGGAWTGLTLGICMLRNYEKEYENGEEKTSQKALRRVGFWLFMVSFVLMVSVDFSGLDIVYWLGEKWQNELVFELSAWCKNNTDF